MGYNATLLLAEESHITDLGSENSIGLAKIIGQSASKLYLKLIANSTGYAVVGRDVLCLGIGYIAVNVLHRDCGRLEKIPRIPEVMTLLKGFLPFTQSI